MKSATLAVLLLIVTPFFILAQGFEWVRTGGGGGQDAGQKMAKDAEGNIYLTGHFSGKGTFEGVTYAGHAGFDVFIAKYQPDGHLVWLVYAGGYDNDEGTGIDVDDAGNIYVTGYFSAIATFGNSGGHTETLSSQGRTDIFLAKYDPNGNLIWAKRAGSTGEDQSNDVVVDKGGNVYISGYFSEGVSFGGNVVSSRGSSDVFVAKYDNAGNNLWAQSFGGYGLDKAKGMDADTSGNVVITGFFQYTGWFSNSSSMLEGDGLSSDIFVIKYNSSGTLLWSNRMGGPYGDAGYDIKTDQTGNFYITGYFLEFAHFGPHTIVGKAYDDIFLAKYDTTMTCEWVLNEGGFHLDIGTGIDVDEFGDIYLTGLFDSLAWFGSQSYFSVNDYDVFVSKISKKGIVIWTKTAGSYEADLGLSVLAGPGKTLYVSGFYRSEPTFGSITTNRAAEADIFITKLSELVGIEEQDSISKEVIIYPNPTSGLLTISSPRKISFVLFNIEGKQILNPISFSGQYHLDISEELNGIYFLRIYTENFSSTFKLLKYSE